MSKKEQLNQQAGDDEKKWLQLLTRLVNVGVQKVKWGVLGGRERGSDIDRQHKST